MEILYLTYLQLGPRSTPSIPVPSFTTCTYSTYEKVSFGFNTQQAKLNVSGNKPAAPTSC